MSIRSVAKTLLPSLIPFLGKTTIDYFWGDRAKVAPPDPTQSGGLLERLGDLLEYLGAYGYLGPKAKDPSQLTIRDILDAVALFRKMFQLGESGELITPEVFRAITYPRCACTDVDGPLALEAEAATNQGYWGLKTLTWFLKKPVRSLSVEVQKRLINKVYSNISDVCDLSFREVFSEGEANLVITCGNSGNGIGSPGGTLAYAYLAPSPNFRGQLQLVMDDAEQWLDTGSNANGILFENVYCHESLHNLGLGHKNTRGAIMQPYYDKNISKPVSPDDIERLQALYGKPKPKPQPPVIPGPTPGNPIDPAEKMTIILTGSVEIPGYLVVKKPV